MKKTNRSVRTTLRSRLTRAVTLLGLGILTLTGLAIYLGARQGLQRNLDDALLTIAETDLASSIDGPGGRVHIHEDAPIPLELSRNVGYEKVAQIRDTTGRILAQTQNTRNTPLQVDPVLEKRARLGTASLTDIVWDEMDYRALYYPVHDKSDRLLIATCAISKQPMQKSLYALLRIIALSLVLGGIALCWIADHLSRYLTRPLQQMALTARSISETSLCSRIPDNSSDAELQDLILILNDMLHRLETAFEQKQKLIDSQKLFITDASHELRSPLANLQGTIEVALRRRRTDDEYRETLRASLVEVERMSLLVSDLLTLSRVDVGGFTFTFMPCDLTEIAQQSVSAHTARAKQAGIRLLFTSPQQPLPLCADHFRLRQAIDNLLDNALRYAPAGSTIRTGVRNEEAAVFFVQDEGSGLSEQEAAHVFDRFYRADPSRSRHTGGLGLGLAIAKAITEAHEGEVLVESVPGQGATFTLRLPLSPLIEQ
jgi:two-component system OmpR family sensor kinase